MAVIRPRPQKPMRTSEGYIQRKQLNTGYLIFSVFSERLTGTPRMSYKPLPLPTQAVALWCSPVTGGMVKC